MNDAGNQSSLAVIVDKSVHSTSISRSCARCYFSHRLDISRVRSTSHALIILYLSTPRREEEIMLLAICSKLRRNHKTCFDFVVETTHIQMIQGDIHCSRVYNKHVKVNSYCWSWSYFPSPKRTCEKNE